MKALIFDSGPLINLAMTGMLDVLERLKEGFEGKFIITRAVKYEIVDRPINVPRFELEALRIRNLIEKGILEFPESLRIKESVLDSETERIMKIANHLIQVGKQPIEIVSKGEMSCLALSNELTKAGIENIIAIDERTIRILSEKPKNLSKLISGKIHQNATLVSKDFSEFSSFKFIRSSELIYVAHKKGLLGISGKESLEASLYATKFHGSSISFDEIKELKRL